MLCHAFFLVYSDRPFSIFQKIPETRRKFPEDWEYHNIDQMNAPDLYPGMSEPELKRVENCMVHFPRIIPLSHFVNKLQSKIGLLSHI